MKDLIDFAIEHQAAATVAGAWMLREIHICWPALVQIYPYLRDNGGIVGVIRNFLVGKTTTPQTPDPKNP